MATRIEKIMKIIGGVYIMGSSTVPVIMQGITDGNVEVVDAAWCDWFNAEHRDAPNMTPPKNYNENRSEWSTYQGCIDYQITPQCEVHVTIWGGDNFDGRKTEKRVTAKLKLTKAILKKAFGDTIEHRFERHVADVIEQEKKKEQAAIIKKRSQSMLSETS